MSGAEDVESRRPPPRRRDDGPWPPRDGRGLGWKGVPGVKTGASALSLGTASDVEDDGRSCSDVSGPCVTRPSNWRVGISRDAVNLWPVPGPRRTPRLLSFPPQSPRPVLRLELRLDVGLDAGASGVAGSLVVGIFAGVVLVVFSGCTSLNIPEGG
jgi:hypothetical protein